MRENNKWVGKKKKEENRIEGRELKNISEESQKGAQSRAHSSLMGAAVSSRVPLEVKASPTVVDSLLLCSFFLMALGLLHGEVKGEVETEAERHWGTKRRESSPALMCTCVPRFNACHQQVTQKAAQIATWTCITLCSITGTKCRYRLSLEELDTSKNPHSPARSMPALPTTSLGRVKECIVLK